MSRLKSPVVRLSIALLLLGVQVLMPIRPVTASASGGGLLNPGFENGTANWVPLTQSADTITAVTGNDAAWPTYADMSVSSLLPWKGAKMLRLGTPKRVAESQSPGTTGVTQTFIANSDSLKFAFRTFSWEFRGYDKVRVEIRDNTALALTLTFGADTGSPIVIDKATVTSTGTSLDIVPNVGKRGNYLATDWIRVRIGGLTPGHTYTISYEVVTVNNNAHATWAYFDNFNTPPVATVTLDNAAPRTNESITAAATKFDADNDAVSLTFVWRNNGTVTQTTGPTTALTDTYDLKTPGHGDVNDNITVEVTPNDGTENGAMVSAQATVANTPPVAQFQYSPASPLEGYRIQLKDLSLDDDHIANPADDRIVSWSWRLYSESTQSAVYSNLREPFIIPADNGKLEITLTVTDSFGATGSTSVPLAAGSASASSITPLVVGNLPPVVKALNTEVISGKKATLFGRFIDPGWTDTHTSQWSGVGESTSSLSEDHFALMGTGIVTGSTTSAPTANITGTLTVSDGTASGAGDFKIRVISDDPNRHEPNNVISTSTANLTSGSIYLSYIQTVGDVDVFELVSGDGTPLVQGSEVLATLKNLPADYDLAILSMRPEAPRIGGATLSGATLSGGTLSGATLSGGTLSGATLSGATLSGATLSGATLSGATLSGATLSGATLSGATLSGATLSGATLSGATLSGATLSGATLSGATLSGATLSGATLSGATLSGATLSGATLSGGTLSGATLSGGTLSGATLSGATLSGATLSGGTLSGGTLSGATLSSATFSGGMWTGATLSGVQVSWTTISNATISGATLSEGTLSGATLSGATLSGATLSGGSITAPRVGGGPNSSSSLSVGAISDLEQYPLSQMGFTGLSGSAQNIGGTDISFAELGVSLADGDLGSIPGQEINVAGFSANRGLSDEVVFTTVETSDTRLFVVVAGANGAFSSVPYSLQIETSSPLNVGKWLSDNSITYAAPVGQWTSSTLPEVVHHTVQPAPLTLFVTQKERMVGRYGGAAWSSANSSLGLLSDRSDIAGDIVSLPISIYERWDKDYSSLDATGNVTAEIRNIVQSYLTLHPTIKYVVFVGNDDMIPFGRVLDQTSLGNERQYLAGSFLKPGSPLFFSVLNGFILTDDFYVDKTPSPWQGTSLYLPDVAVSRLVETPAEIAAAADAFRGSQGVLKPGTGLVTGYDFFVDAAEADIAHLLDAHVVTDNLTSQLWKANDLASALAGNHGINNINAHYTSFAALSAGGFSSGNFSDILTSAAMSSAAGNYMKLIFFTMGCHAGLSVPDAAAPSGDELGLSIDPRADFPQAMRQAIYVGNTGYGYGDDEGLGGTEHLMSIFAKKLLQSDYTAGDALRAAKQRYISGLSTVSAYEEKASLQFTFYGLPQYKVNAPSPLLPDPFDSPDGTLHFTVDNDVKTFDLAKVNTGSGSYWTADGDAQATPWRPILPRIVYPIPSGASPVHGVRLMSGNFTDYLGFNPVITRPTNEWEVGATESQLLPPSFWPAELATVNTLETGGQLAQTLVVIPGQFQPTGTQGGSAMGTMRVNGDLRFELLRSASADWQAPQVTGVDLKDLGNGNVAVSVGAADPSGIASVYVFAFRPDGSIVPGSLSLTTPLPASGNFTVAVPYADGYQLVIQVTDGANNVATYTGKGAGISLIHVDAGPDLAAYDPPPLSVPITLVADVTDFGNLVTPVFYTWDFGDGHVARGQTSTGSFTTPHTYTAAVAGRTVPQFKTTLKVTDSAGGIGVDNTRVTAKTSPVVTVVSSNSSTVLGQSVTFTATVSANTTLTWPIWQPVPTGGTLTFTDNVAGVLAIVPVISGSANATASTTNSTLAIGGHTITVTYSGDAFFLPGGSGGVSQNVTYKWSMQSPIDGSQYNIGRNLPVKFAVTDFNGAAVTSLSPEVQASLSGEGGFIKYGIATISGGQYQFGLDTTRLAGAQTGDLLTIRVLLGDGAIDHVVRLTLK